MGYYLKGGRSSRGMALGGTSCGAGQTYRGNVTFNGIQGQCMTDAQYNECKSTGKYAGMPCKVSTDYSSIAQGLLSIFVPASTGLPSGAVVAPSGMSTTTKLAIAAGAVALVAVIATRR